MPHVRAGSSLFPLCARPCLPRKSPKSNHSHTSRLSPQSNHSRTFGMTGGGGCTGFLVRPIRSAPKPFVSPTYAHFAGNFFASPTYAEAGGYTPCGKCRRADILDFSPYILKFLGRLLRQRLLYGSDAPEVLPGFRQ